MFFQGRRHPIRRRLLDGVAGGVWIGAGSIGESMMVWVDLGILDH